MSSYSCLYHPYDLYKMFLMNISSNITPVEPISLVHSIAPFNKYVLWIIELKLHSGLELTVTIKGKFELGM